MEIRCEKCDTTYEFDVSRITDTGINVKCSQCGNLFRVRRRPQIVTREMPGLRGLSSQLGSQDGPPSREVLPKDRAWLLRLKHTQEVLRFRDLSMLRQWIIEKRVTRDDDISRAGTVWRRLGTIVELESFFHAAEQVEMVRLRTGKTGRVGAPSTASRGAPLAQEPRRLRSGTPGLGVGPPLSGSSTHAPIRATLKLAEEGAPQAPLRLSSTGRTMRPRLQQEPPTPQPEYLPPPRLAAPATPPESPVAADLGAPEPVSERPSGAIPRHISASAPERMHRYQVPEALAAEDPPREAGPATPPAASPVDEPRPAARLQGPPVQKLPPTGQRPPVFDLSRAAQAPRSAPAASESGDQSGEGPRARAHPRLPPPLPTEVDRPIPAPALPGLRVSGPAKASKAGPPAALEKKGAPSRPAGSPVMTTDSWFIEDGDLIPDGPDDSIADEIAPADSPAPESRGGRPHPAFDEGILRADPVPRHLQKTLGVEEPESLPGPVPGPVHELGDLSEEELAEPPPPRSRSAFVWLVSAAVLVAIGVFAGVYLLAQQPAGGLGQNGAYRRSAQAFAEGQRLFWRDAEDGFQQAHDELLRAAVADDTNPLPLAALAELHATWVHDLHGSARGAEPGVAVLFQQEAERHEEIARRYADQAMALGAAQEDVNRAMATVLIETGAKEAQIEPYLERAGQKQKGPELLYARALLQLREGRSAEARTLLEEIVAQAAQAHRPPLLRAFMLLGGIEADAGDKEAARAHFTQVLAENPQHKRAQQALAALAPGSHGTPLASLERKGAPGAADADGGTGPAPDLRPGAGQQAAADMRPAMAPRTRVENRDPDTGPMDFRDQMALAQRFLERHKAREAQRIYDRLLPEHQDDPEVHVGLGDCAAETEHFQAAVSHYKDALGERADYPPALFGLGEVYRLRGDRAQALEWYRAYMDRYPNGPQATAVRNHIARLEAQRPAEDPVPRAAPVPDGGAQ